MRWGGLKFQRLNLNYVKLVLALDVALGQVFLCDFGPVLSRGCFYASIGANFWRVWARCLSEMERSEPGFRDIISSTKGLSMIPNGGCFNFSGLSRTHQSDNTPDISRPIHIY